MVTAIILFKVGRSRINEIAEKLASIEELSEVFSVTGSYDLVAIARIKTNDDLSTLVTERLGEVDGIESTDTMLAFKAYSRHDLESMFSL
ncbi:MAG: Lrp/AsnC ligand binding domain-containing protein [Immundisolibacteraceae bacterium]|jgi:DNA-binding Lrp family transcriptional regulator|nr:Lrp/AsnC ligand binding domain-containing protein [Immundisolibacteraceae bacterium]